MEILYHTRGIISANIGTVDCKGQGIENTNDIMRIEHHPVTECYISKFQGSFACLLTAYSLKLKCSIQTNTQIETQAVNYIHNRSMNTADLVRLMNN